MVLAINPLIALGVVASTAMTDAAFVFFTAAVTARRRFWAANWSAFWYLLSAFAVISYTEGPIMLGHNRKKMLGAECMADMLKGYGVTHVFHVPAVLRRSFVEMERRTDIKRLHVHGEKSAAYMADGYARASGKPGICMAQVIGALNLAAGLRDAWLAHAPG